MEKPDAPRVPTPENPNWRDELARMLTPEVKEKILDKIVDLSEMDTRIPKREDEIAFSGVRGPDATDAGFEPIVENVLRWGLLGGNRKGLPGKEWAMATRSSEQPPIVWFHIKNHQRYDADWHKPIGNYFGGYPRFVFDHSFLTEIEYDFGGGGAYDGGARPPEEKFTKERAKQHLRKYAMPDGGESSPIDHGFKTPYNIPAKYLKGIILRGWPKKKSESALQTGLDKALQAMLRVYGKNPERMLPVYDSEGNLLWPTQLSKEEVKNIVLAKSGK